jgi:hypothetical protein
MLLLVSFFLLTVVAGAAGGALSGLKIAGKDLGNALASMMGAFYGVMPVLPAALAIAAYLLFAAHSKSV